MPVDDSRAETVTFLALLLLPVGISAAFSLRDPVAPDLAVRTDRPALVFASYLYSTGSDPIEDQPIVTEEFPFLNTQDHEVRITHVKASCGCLAPRAEPEVIPPGATGRVILPVRTASEAAGPHEYLVTVSYEDPKPREVVLTWQVVLPEKQIRVQPKVLMVMGNYKPEDTFEITVSDYRTAAGRAPLNIREVHTSSPLIQATHEGVAPAGSNGSATVARIAVRFPEQFPAGRHRGLVQLLTDDPAFPCLSVPVVVGNPVRPDHEQVKVTPENGRVMIHRNRAGDSTGQTLVFEVPSAWKISHCDVFPSQLSAELGSPENLSADRVRIAVRLSVDSLPAPGAEHGLVSLQARDGEQPELVTVPISLVWQ